MNQGQTAAAEPRDHLLSVMGLSKSFGALKAVEGVSFEAHSRQVCSIIGPNGAGKTTIFNVITGVYPATAGEATFSGQAVLGLPEHKITELGIARTYQLIRVFKKLTVLENVVLGRHCRTRSGVWDALAQTPRARIELKSSRERALDLLHSLGLSEYEDELAGNLPYGYQRRVEIARALATDPHLLLVDEPTAGMNPAEKDEMMALIDGLTDSGIGVLLVEHDMDVVMGISDWILCLNHGVKIAEGTPTEIQCNDDVIEAYLGRKYRDEPAAS